MKPLPHAMAVGFADLVDRVHDAAFDERFSANGTFVQMTRGGKAYWYHMAHDASLPSKQRSTYAGPVGDPKIDGLVASFGQAKSDYTLRKETASLLRRAGLPAPDAFEGALAEAFQKAGLFQAGALLVGSVAYQSYAGLLGVRLDGALLRTQDIDIAQDRQIALVASGLGSQVDDMERILKSVDPSFRPLFNPAQPTSAPTRYMNARQYKVDLLTAPITTDRDRTKPVTVDILPGAALQPLELLDVLIERPVRSALLHGAGVAVVVAEPAAYAIHKIAISQMRSATGEATKSAKDIAQAGELIRALLHARRGADLNDAFQAIHDRKAKWRRKLLSGLLALDRADLTALANTIAAHGGPLFELSSDPEAAVTVALKSLSGKTGTGKTEPSRSTAPLESIREAIAQVSWLRASNENGKIQFDWEGISDAERQRRLALMDSQPALSKSMLIEEWRTREPDAFDAWDRRGRTPDPAMPQKPNNPSGKGGYDPW